MHYGRQNVKFEHLVKEQNGSIGFLEKFNQQRDLGVIFSNNLNLVRTIPFIMQKDKHDFVKENFF